MESYEAIDETPNTRGNVSDALERVLSPAEFADFRRVNKMGGPNGCGTPLHYWRDNRSAILDQLDYSKPFRDTVTSAMEAVRDGIKSGKNISLCANCGKKSTSRCGQCKKARYCSSECQKVHWKVHRSSCSASFG